MESIFFPLPAVFFHPDLTRFHCGRCDGLPHAQRRVAPPAQPPQLVERNDARRPRWATLPRSRAAHLATSTSSRCPRPGAFPCSPRSILCGVTPSPRTLGTAGGHGCVAGGQGRREDAGRALLPRSHCNSWWWGNHPQKKTPTAPELPPPPHLTLNCREEPDEIQQGKVQGPAPGEEQPHAPVQAGADLLESSSAERDWECWGTTG